MGEPGESASPGALFLFLSGRIETLASFTQSFPEQVFSMPCLTGKRNDVFGLQRCLERIQRGLQARSYPVRFRRDHHKGTVYVTEPFDKLNVAILRWDVRVDQAHTESQGWAPRKVRVYEFRPLVYEVFRCPRVAIARQVGEQQVGLGPSRPSNLEEVDGLRSSGRIAGLGYFVADEGVDEAGLSNVRPSEESNLGRARDRKLLRVNTGS